MHFLSNKELKHENLTLAFQRNFRDWRILTIQWKDLNFIMWGKQTMKIRRTFLKVFFSNLWIWRDEPEYKRNSYERCLNRVWMETASRVLHLSRDARKNCDTLCTCSRKKKLKYSHLCAFTSCEITLTWKWKCMKGNFNVERKKRLSGSLSIRLGQCLRSLELALKKGPWNEARSWRQRKHCIITIECTFSAFTA